MSKHVVVVLLGATLAGCGTGGSSIGVKAGSGRPLTKQAYILRANDVCHTFDPQIKALIPTTRGQQQSIVFLDQAIPIWRRQLAEFRKLSPPLQDRVTIDNALALFASSIEQWQRALDATRKTDAESFTAASQSALGLAADSVRALGRAGVTGCGTATP